MITNVTRGGQLFIHRVVMLKQVLVKTIKWSFVLSLITTLFYVIQYDQRFKKVDVYSAISYPYIRAKYLLNDSIDLISRSNKKPMSITYFGRSGIINSNVKIANSDPYVIRHYGKLLDLIMTELYLLSICFLSSTLLISIFWYYFGHNMKSTKTSSSNKILSAVEVSNILKSINKQSHFRVGDLHLVKDSETKHILVTGSTGSGKTNLMHSLLPQIIKKKQGMVIVDQTGEMVQRYYRKGIDFIIDQDHEESVVIDFMSEMRDGYLNTIASTLYSDKSSDDVWNLSSKTLFIDSTNTIIRNNKNVADLYNMLCISEINQIYQELKDTQSSRLIDPKNDKTSMSVLMNTVASLDFLKVLIAMNNKPKIDISSFIQSSIQSGSILFLSSSPISRAKNRSLFAIIIELLVMHLMNLKPDYNRRMWFVIDEMASLKHLPNLTSALSELRKYGGAVLSGIQTISQLNKIYGNHDTKTILSQFNTKFFFKNSDTEVSNLLSNLFGETETTERTENMSYGAHSMRDGVNIGSITKTKKLVTSDMLSNLEPLECFVSLPESRVSRVRCKMRFFG